MTSVDAVDPALGGALYGLSGQTTDYQREMATRLKVPFPILSDAGRHTARALGLPIFETGNEIYLERLTRHRRRLQTILSGARPSTARA